MELADAWSSLMELADRHHCGPPRISSNKLHTDGHKTRRAT